MADHTGIEWTDATWNPVVGCSLVSPGCTNCYAMGQAARIVRCSEGLGRASTYDSTVETVKGKPVWTGKVALASDATLTQPLRWKKPRRIFVNSMGDLFHEDVPDEWIDRVFAVMALAPQHTYQILTKRSARMRAYMSDPTTPARISEWIDDLLPKLTASQIDNGATNLEPVGAGFKPRWPLPNVWLGVSAEDQRRADERIPDLLATPAAIRFVSAEPLLGPIRFDHLTINSKGYWTDSLWRGSQSYHGPALDWVIVGGESGRNARPMHPDWARAIRDQCATADVAFFFKQWGEWSPHTAALEDSEGSIRTSPRGGVNWQAEKPGGAFGVFRVGKARAGRLLDGVTHNAFPSCSGLSRASTPSSAEP